MEHYYIDINCDVGEGVGNEKDLFSIISSCNIACGGHAGSYNTMTSVARLAKRHRIKVGAHPGYPDRENFGRKSLAMSPKDLITTIQDQIADLMTILDKENIPLHHIKAHGALYNDIAKDKVLAKTFLDAISPYSDNCFLYVPYGSEIEQLALEHGLSIVREAFADRNYNADLSLVARTMPNALIEDPKEAFQHLVFMVKNKAIKTADGEAITMYAETYCIHGDTASALEILTYLSDALPKQNIYIKK
ncbi:5-oxoprolinase subunit PxpA [Spongiimicrobium sp. 3-5]|uniref:5-oxoprolinase subunit PxpA n=1 Tax=Spongiimicrobium sp. 3-5 TaxID=3332596 RepID=UPI003980941C